MDDTPRQTIGDVAVRDFARAVFTCGMWVMVFGLALGFLASAGLHDDLRASNGLYVRGMLALFFLETFRFHVAVALVLAGVLAWWFKARRLLIAVALLAAYAGSPTMHDFLPKGTPALPANAQKMDVFNVNLLAWNRDFAGLRSEILNSNADVVTLQEYHDRWHDELAEALRKVYPHQVSVPRKDAFGIAVYSKYPLREVRTDLWLGLDCPQIRVVVDLNGRSVALYSIHLMPPAGSRRAAQQRLGMSELLQILEKERYPAVVCGDFNMTRDCSMARQLQAAGYRETHSVRGFGRQSTWPNEGILSHTPGIRIDHIYFKHDAFECLASGTGEGRGSDHRPVFATLALK